MVDDMSAVGADGNSIRRAIREKRIPIGLQSAAGSRDLIEVAGQAGFDFVMIDREHTSLTASGMEDLIRAADASNLMPLVRVAQISDSAIRQPLDAGAQGVMIPQVRSRADVKRAVGAAQFPPKGVRGMGYTRAMKYNFAYWDEYARRNNEEILVIPILEHPSAIEDVEAICQVEGVDIVCFGPADLSLAMGLGSDGLRRQEIEDALDHTISTASASGTAVMTVPFPDLSGEACEALIQRGVKILLHSIDKLLFWDLCRQILQELGPVLRRQKA